MPRRRIEIHLDHLDQLLDQGLQAPLSASSHHELKAALHTMAEALMRGRSTEKTRAVVDAVASTPGAEAASDPEKNKKKKRKGHGRTPASAYTGATEIHVPHPKLQHGGPCPECPKGKVYAQKASRPMVRIVGQAPLAATVYHLQELRCNACGAVFTASAPEGVGPEKFDETATAMIVQLKYGSGMPGYRLAGLGKRLGVPLPVGTQWEIVQEAADLLRPWLEELIRQAAQGDLFHNDDTSVRILKLERPVGDQRTGIFTSAVLSVLRAAGVEIRIALFFSGWEHAGENLAKVLKQRAAELEPPLLMSDALSRNVPAGVDLLWANCMSHGRRNFVDVVGNFPAECRYVLETLGGVYANDALTKERKMTPAERLAFHQQHSQPLMDGLQQWMQEQFAQRKVEPNSGLGKAIAYMQKHWEKLTLFLREPGAPLDNNICEQALKMAILHRKNALFYRTMNGARAGDLFMSLIHTCSLNGVNSFDYLVELLRHPREIAARPQDWMPWNYRQSSIRADAAA